MGRFPSGFRSNDHIKSKDFDYKFEYGDIYLTIYVEGVRQKLFHLSCF